MAAADRGTVSVEVVYAEPDRQHVRTVVVREGSTLRAAIEQSGLLVDVAGIDLTKNKVGIFNRLARLDDIVRHDDRIEIYRPLIADPKELRRNRAFKTRAKG